LTTTTPEEIEEFLNDVKKTIWTSFEQRFKPKNKNTLTALGYNWDDVKREIASLTYKDYIEGPIQEHGTINFVWKFGKIVQDKEIYIKIKLIGINNLGEKIDTVYCLSFHFKEKNINYPYK